MTACRENARREGIQFHRYWMPCCSSSVLSLLAATGLLMSITLTRPPTTAASSSSTTSSQRCPPYILWSDEFQQKPPGNTRLDPAKWSFENGDGCAQNICGWGNNELQWYQPPNARITPQGKLVLTARYTPSSPETPYSSSRISSKYKGDFGPGGGGSKTGGGRRFEARLKLPDGGQGLWPAFWMMPTNGTKHGNGWPNNGEIDIMEQIGKEPYTVHGTIHYGTNPGSDHQYHGTALSQPREYSVQQRRSLSSQFHVYAVEREEYDDGNGGGGGGGGLIRWMIDDEVYYIQSSDTISPYDWSPFNEKFYFLFNVAVGGLWPGNPTNATKFPTELVVDYVRVWEGTLPTLAGRRVVPVNETGAVYELTLPESFVDLENVSWSVPSDAVIVGGGMDDAADVPTRIVVNFGKQSGYVSATITSSSSSSSVTTGDHSSCRNNDAFVKSYEMYVVIVHAPQKVLEEVVILSFGEGVLLPGGRNKKNEATSYVGSSGIFESGVSNPKNNTSEAPSPSSGRNENGGGISSPPSSPTSTWVGKYERDGFVRWDYLTFRALSIPNAGLFAVGGIQGGTGGCGGNTERNVFVMDVYTSTAPVGTEIMLQLEDSSRTAEGEYPVGRHSRYRARTTTQNAWTRLEFEYVDSPDPDTPDDSVDTVVLLFNGDTFTSDTYYMDHVAFQVIGSDIDGYPRAPPPPESLEGTVLAADEDKTSSPAISVRLTWVYPQTEWQNGFTIERREAMPSPGIYSAFQELTRTGPTDRECSDDTVVTGTTYEYRVIAFNEWGTSMGSEMVEAVIRHSYAPTPAPTWGRTDDDDDDVIIFDTYDGRLSSAHYLKSSGTFTSNQPNPDTTTPLKGSMNPSQYVGLYQRDANAQYDTLFYETGVVTSSILLDFAAGRREFSLSIFSQAPRGTKIILQLEDSSIANASNYPAGRHSRYFALTTEVNAWERLVFYYVDSPAESMVTAHVDRIVLLFSPGTSSNDFFFIDNLMAVVP